MFLASRKLLDEADEGKDLGGGATSQKSEEVTLLTQNMQLLAAGLEELKNNQSAITETLAKIAEAGGATRQEAKEIADDLSGDVDLEQLSRKDFAKLILDTVERGVDGKLKGGITGLAERLDKIAARIESESAGTSVEKAAANHADFFEWTEEMRGILRENPTMSVERAYKLAKAEHPEKVEKLKPKYEKSNKTKSTFSLFSTNSGGSAEGAGKMTAKDAALAAFDDTMAKFDLHNADGIKLG